MDGDLIYGRGVEDNHQGLVASLLVAEAVLAGSEPPPINFGMLFVADEETASAKGLDYVLTHRRDLFGPRDLILIPDFGTADGEMVEVAEKSLLWLKFSVFGKQCHASTPQKGVNSLVAASDLILRLRSCTPASTTRTRCSFPQLHLRSDEKGSQRPQREHHSRAGCLLSGLPGPG